MTSLLVGLAIIFCLLMSNLVNTQSTLALQERCAVGAKKFIADPENLAVYSSFTGYINYYSKKFDK
jgi:hypothetical protein